VAIHASLAEAVAAFQHTDPEVQVHLLRALADLIEGASAD